MKRLAKKTNAVALSAVLALAASLAGCGKDPSAGSSNDGTPAQPKATITVSMYDRGNIPPEVGTVDNNLWTKWVNENSGVNVQFVPVPRSNSVEKFNALLAAGEAPNLILEYDASFRHQLYLQKQIMPLDEMIDKYSKDYKQLLEKFLSTPEFI